MSVIPPGLADIRGVRSGHLPVLGRTPRLHPKRPINPCSWRCGKSNKWERPLNNRNQMFQAVCNSLRHWK